MTQAWTLCQHGTGSALLVSPALEVWKDRGQALQGGLCHRELPATRGRHPTAGEKPEVQAQELEGPKVMTACESCSAHNLAGPRRCDAISAIETKGHQGSSAEHRDLVLLHSTGRETCVNLCFGGKKF